MKKICFILILACSSLLFVMSGCKKDSSSTEIDLTSDVTYQTDDQAMFSAEDDAVSDDINGVLETDPLLGGKTNIDTCNVTITRDSTLLKRFVILTYSGNNCSGTRTRQGVVKLGMNKNTKWKNAGAEISVEIQNLKITRLRDNKSLVLNGTKILTNVSGHLLRELITGGVSNIVHTVASSNMSATFDNGTSRQWQIAKQRTFTYNTGFVISVTGTATVDGATNVAVWGTNRFGQSFSTRVINPMVIKADCDYRIVSGKLLHTKLTRDITVTFGLDASGNPTSCPGSANPYYFKAEWTSLNGTAYSIIKPY